MDFVLNGREYEVIEHGSPLSEEELCAFEAQIHIRLPPQLRSYYLKWNGGLPLPTDIPKTSTAWVRVEWPAGSAAESAGSAVILSELLVISSDPETEFLGALNNFGACVSDEYLCFARDPGSSFFLIGIGKENFGRIFFLGNSFRVSTFDGQLLDYSEIAYVADSFVEFLLALREEPGDDEPLEDWVKRVYPA